MARDSDGFCWWSSDSQGVAVLPSVAAALQASEPMKAIVGSTWRSRRSSSADKTDDDQGAGARRSAKQAARLAQAGAAMADGRGGRREGGRHQGGARRVRRAERRGRCGGEGGRLDRRQRPQARLLSDGQAVLAAGGRQDPEPVLRHGRCRPAASSRRCSTRGTKPLPSPAAHPACTARQRPRRARPRGSRLPDRRRQRLVSRRLEEREAGPHRASRTCSST